MKKVMFVSPSLTSGGSERVMALLASELSDKYSVKLCLVREKDDTYKVNKNVNIVRYKNCNKKIINIFKRIIFIRQEAKKNDVIVSFMYDINFMTIIACLGLKKRVIVSERGFPKQENKKSILIPILRRLLYIFPECIVFQTSYVQDFFPKYIAKKSVVIPNPISNDLPKRELNKINKTIVAAGRLTEQKNFELLIDGFCEFNKRNQDYNLVIYGDGSLRENLEKRIKDLNLEKKIKMPGYVENVNDLMKNCKIYVSTSNYEGISNSMLEAMAMGIPSICTDCPVYGARMVIQNGINGILIPINNKEELVEGMISLVENDDLYKKITKESAKIIEKFSLENICQEWEKIF